MKKRELTTRLEKAVTRLEAFNDNPHEPHSRSATQAVDTKLGDMLQVIRVWRERQEGYAAAGNTAQHEHIYAAGLLRRLEAELIPAEFDLCEAAGYHICGGPVE